MPVRVDQTRHENPSAAIDRLRTIRRGGIAGRDGLDPIALDEQTQSVAQGAGVSVEQPEVCEQDGVRRSCTSRTWLRAGALREPERRDRASNPCDKAAPRQVRTDPARQGMNFRPVAEAATMTGGGCVA